MTDLIDRAAVEADAYIADFIRRHRKSPETPDVDESGRYCLGCSRDGWKIHQAWCAVSRVKPKEKNMENVGELIRNYWPLVAGIGTFA